jgi:hypothetical protein
VSSAVKQRARITKYARRGSPHPAEEDPMTLSTMSTFSEESDLDTSGGQYIFSKVAVAGERNRYLMFPFISSF